MIEGGLQGRFHSLLIVSVARTNSQDTKIYKIEYLRRVLFNDWKNREGDQPAKIYQESMLPCYYFSLILLALAMLAFVLEGCGTFRNRVHHMNIANDSKCKISLRCCLKLKENINSNAVVHTRIEEQ